MSAKITTLFTLFILITGSINVFAQRDSVMLSGIVYDYESREALKKATFKHNGEFVDISQDGKFQRFVKPGDTLSVRYLGYKDYIIVVPNNLDQVSYISGIFLNKNNIENSEILTVPREYKVDALATYDPMQLQGMLQNAQHNVAVAAYQATQPYEWDVHDNQKFSMTMKEMDIEYKNAIKPTQQVAISANTSLQNPKSDARISEFGKKGLERFTPISPEEEYYIKALFEAGLQEGGQ